MIEAIARAYNIQAVFIWQPVPLYKYDLQYHPFASKTFGPQTYSQYGYPRMRKYIDLHPCKNNFIWAADIQENLQQPLYVDQIHYSAEMCELFAQHIGKEIIRRNLLALQRRARFPVTP